VPEQAPHADDNCPTPWQIAHTPEPSGSTQAPQHFMHGDMTEPVPPHGLHASFMST